MRGGRRPGAGRKKGSRNRASIAREREIAASGLTPPAYMPAIMRDNTQPMAVRMEIAKAAAPYVHPRLATVEQSGNHGESLPHHITVRFVSPKRG